MYIANILTFGTCDVIIYEFNHGKMLLVIVTLYLASYCCILVLPHDVDGSGPCRSNSIKERRW